MKQEQKQKKIRWMLVLYDFCIFLASAVLILVLYHDTYALTAGEVTFQIALTAVIVFACRLIGNIYGQIWRYGGIQCYIRLLITDAVAFIVCFVANRLIPCAQIAFDRLLAWLAVNLLGALTIRMVYRYAFKCGNSATRWGRFLNWLLRTFGGLKREEEHRKQKIPVAIIGAGRVGVSLAEDLLNNKATEYIPRCFIDISRSKVGREIQGLPVLAEGEATFRKLREEDVQELICAVHALPTERMQGLYKSCKEAGFKLKIYDYPIMQSAGGKRHLRDFSIEDLLFRKPRTLIDDQTCAYYQGKVILITGGGGSIGSELCRQLARMKPKQLILLDIYENGAYDVQQELKMLYGNKLNLQVEIGSITNPEALKRVMECYHPQILIHAAAHKHVPLMEHNCIESIQNNVFGTKKVLEACEKYGVERFMMVSTDKAVNPTNVMGATKRMCEMLAQNTGSHGKVQCTCTRFGNVLGSAGSVIPLFKRQIASGGPVTVTDKRIIRYFMTIPEASQLVLQSGALAKNGELFVLDMGKPVRILDLAENMIRLSGASDIEIVETGLRPGEKLYEELLVQTEKLDKTSNELIFVEKDTVLSDEEIREKLQLLKEACETGDDDAAREALKKAVPTFRSPEEVNRDAEEKEKEILV